MEKKILGGLYLKTYITHIFRYLKKLFKQADKNGNGKLSLDECEKVIDQLNMKIPDENLKTLFNAANYKGTYL